MTQMAMVFDLDRCIACHSCTVACKQENNVRLGAFWSKVLAMGCVLPGRPTRVRMVSSSSIRTSASAASIA